MAATYTPIATTTLGSASSLITFSSIPSTYTDLRLVLIGKADTSSYLAGILRFNSDTGNNYSYTYLAGTGSSVVTGPSTNNSCVNLANQYSIDSTTPGLIIVDIFSYAGSTYKTLLSTASNDQNGSGSTEQVVGLWRSTSAISTITIGDTFGVGFTATLYGIQAA